MCTKTVLRKSQHKPQQVLTILYAVYIFFVKIEVFMIAYQLLDERKRNPTTQMVISYYSMVDVLKT